MSEDTQSNSQQMIVIALVVIAVLLVAIVGVMVFKQSKANTAIPTPTANGANTAAGSAGAAGAAAGAAGNPPAGMGGATGAPAAPFDAKTATKVPSGQTPEQMLKTYGDDILANKYAEAYKLLPLDKQQSYGDAAAYESQVKAYGITKFNMGKPVVEGDTTTIVSEQVTPQMPITYTWSFKKVGDQWFVESRTMGGSLQ